MVLAITRIPSQSSRGFRDGDVRVPALYLNDWMRGRGRPRPAEGCASTSTQNVSFRDSAAPFQSVAPSLLKGREWHARGPSPGLGAQSQAGHFYYGRRVLTKNHRPKERTPPLTCCSPAGPFCHPFEVSRWGRWGRPRDPPIGAGIAAGPSPQDGTKCPCPPAFRGLVPRWCDR